MSNDLNITSTPFLFLFLPIATGLYYLIPRKNGLKLRNLYFVLISLFFYAWGEPLFVFFLLGMVAFTWLFGNMAQGRKGTVIGKTAVTLTVIVNVAVMLFLGNFSAIADAFGQRFGIELPFEITALPLGFSFFVFFSISYVVDIYRGACGTKVSFLNTALYTCSFFKVLQGPIVSYRSFEEQIENRVESVEQIGEGVWRFAIGFGKKMILVGNLSSMVKFIFSSDTLSLSDAWLGCLAYLVYLYFDFSGYSDMAIGLGKMFGFSVPENFNYPYVSTSVGEFWRRFHITLCAWFSDYLYYPFALGPSVRLRRHLLRCHVNEKVAKTVQGIFIPAVVWTVTALWHGMNLNYLIWGLANCSAMLVEARIKPLPNKRLDTALRRLGLLLFLFLSVPLIGIESFDGALSFYRAMIAGELRLSATSLYLLETYWPFLAVGAVGCFPVVPRIRKAVSSKSNGRYQTAWKIGSAVLLSAVVLLSLAYLFKTGTSDFLYQQ